MKFKLILSLLAVTILSACSCEPYEEEARSGQKQEKAAISASGCNGDENTPQKINGILAGSAAKSLRSLVAGLKQGLGRNMEYPVSVHEGLALKGIHCQPAISSKTNGQSFAAAEDRCSVSVQVAFDKDIDTFMQIHASDKNGVELGRSSKTPVVMAANNESCLRFNFDEHIPLNKAARMTLYEAKAGRRE